LAQNLNSLTNIILVNAHYSVNERNYSKMGKPACAVTLYMDYPAGYYKLHIFWDILNNKGGEV
jgi:hypothetical protein